MKLKNDISAQGATTYAAGSDFCQIFADDMEGLYLLSFLLTADPGKAEQCFISGLEESMNSNRIFRDWARSWSHRVVIQNAIRVMNPTPDRAHDRPTLLTDDVVPQVKSEKAVALRGVLSLRTFDRFVFVMSILEHYSDQDCSVLLQCSRRDVALAKARAVQHIASAAESDVPATESATTVLAHPQWLAQSAW